MYIYILIIRPCATYGGRGRTPQSVPSPLTGAYRLEGATLANRLAASPDYKHSWQGQLIIRTLIIMIINMLLLLITIILLIIITHDISTQVV